MLSKTLILLACMAIQRTLAEMSVDEYQFRYFSRIHQEVCQPIGECLEQQTTPEGGVEISRVPKQCCGECSCKPDCFTLGNCCLKMYDSFEHGIRIVSKSR